MTTTVKNCDKINYALASTKISMSRKTYLFSTEIHIIHMIDTKKFDFHHYAKKYFFTAHDSKKRAATLNRRAATVKGGQPRFTEKIRA